MTTIKLDTNYIDKLNTDGIKYNKLGEYQKAIDTFSKIIDSDNKYKYAFNNRGLSYFNIGEYQKAIEDYSKAIDLDNKYKYAFNNRGLSYFNIGEYQKAIEDYSKAIDLDNTYTYAFNNRGLSYFNIGEYQKAIEDYSKAIDLDNTYTYAFYNRGVSYANIGDYQKAIEDYSKAINLDNKYTYAFNNRGISYANIGENQKAIEDYSKAINLDNKYKSAFHNRGISYANIGDYQKAIEDYSKAIDLDNKYKSAFNNRGISYANIGENQKAIEDYSKAINLDNKYKSAFHNRGISYANIGKDQKAIEDYSKAIDLDNTYTYAFYNRGVSYANIGDYQKAIEDYSKAINLDNKYTYAFNNRGVSYANIGDYQKAIEDYSKAIDLDNTHKYTFYNRGLSYANIDEYQKAIEDYSKSIAIDKEYEYPYRALSTIYEKFRIELNGSKTEKKVIRLLSDYENLLQAKDFYAYIEKKLENLQNKEFKDDLKKLYNHVTSIKSNIKYTGNDDLGHYTKIQNLKWLVKRSPNSAESSFLRLNNIEYMNDPDEGNTFINLFSSEENSKELLNAIYNIPLKNSEKRSEIKSEGNIFLSSLSKNIDSSLPMWRQYANDGDGCCLVFDSTFFKEDFEFKKLNTDTNTDINTDTLPQNIKIDGLYNVIYINNNKVLENPDVENDIISIANILNRIYDKLNKENKISSYNDVLQVIREILDHVRFLFKDNTYSYEEEIRLLKFEDIEDINNTNVHCTSEIEGFTIPRLYINFEKDIQLKEIILGPKVSNEKGIANYIRYTRKSDIITKSKIRYQ